MAYFENTTIPNNVLDAMRAEDPGKYDRILAQLSNAIINQDSRDANEAIMKIAYFSKQKEGSQEYGVGPGNTNVDKIHSGHWRVNKGIIANYLPWAAEHVNSSNSSYKQWNGDMITFDDKMGAAINGKIVDWGQPGHTEGGGKMGVPNPNIGKDAAPPTNPVHTGGATNSDLGAIWPNVDWTTQGSPGAEGPEQYPYWTAEDVSIGAELPAQKQIDLSAYRTGSKDYWNKYIPQESRGLLEMTQQLQPEYSLAYQPGEFRDPTTWAAGAGGGGEGHVPEGAWRRAAVNPRTAAHVAAGTQGYTAAGNPRQNIYARDNTGAYRFINAPGWTSTAAPNPWDFTSPAMGTNIARQPWSATDLNLNQQTAANWKGLLADIDTSPQITPGLLTAEKGGPISFGGKKTGSVFTVDN